MSVSKPLMWLIFGSTRTSYPGQIKHKILWCVWHMFNCSCINKLGIPMYLIDMFDNHIKASCAWFDLDLMFGLTQLVTTSKACWQTGVTFMMDTDKQGSILRKKFEKLNWQLDNPDLSKNQRKKKEDEVEYIKKQLKALESQLSLQVTKLVHTTHDQWGGYHGGPRVKPSWDYVLGKPFNELLNLANWL